MPKRISFLTKNEEEKYGVSIVMEEVDELSSILEVSDEHSSDVKRKLISGRTKISFLQKMQNELSGVCHQYNIPLEDIDKLILLSFLA